MRRDNITMSAGLLCAPVILAQPSSAPTLSPIPTSHNQSLFYWPITACDVFVTSQRVAVIRLREKGLTLANKVIHSAQMCSYFRVIGEDSPAEGGLERRSLWPIGFK